MLGMKKTTEENELFINNIKDAAIAKDSAKLHVLLKVDTLLSTYDRNGLNVAHILGKSGDLESCLFLAKHGAKWIDFAFGAALANNMALALRFLNSVQDKSDFDYNFVAAGAAMGGHLDCVMYFLKHIKDKSKREYHILAEIADFKGYCQIASILRAKAEKAMSVSSSVSETRMSSTVFETKSPTAIVPKSVAPAATAVTLKPMAVDFPAVARIQQQTSQRHWAIASPLATEPVTGSHLAAPSAPTFTPQQANENASHKRSRKLSVEDINLMEQEIKFLQLKIDSCNKKIKQLQNKMGSDRSLMFNIHIHKPYK